MKDVWLRLEVNGKERVEHFEDVLVVHSDGQDLWLCDMPLRYIARFPLNQVREILGTPLAVVT